MAAPTIRQIMQGIEARLATISGLRTSEFLPDQVTPPHAVVGIPSVANYHGPFARDFRLDSTVTVLVSSVSDRAGQLNLADYADPTGAKSILAAIEADQTLGSVVSNCIVTGFRPLWLQEVGLIGYYGGVFDLQVTAS